MICFSLILLIVLKEGFMNLIMHKPNIYDFSQKLYLVNIQY